MKKPVALCLFMGVAVFACMCVCSGVAAIAGSDDSSWDGPGAPIEIRDPGDRLSAPEAPTEPTYYDYEYSHNDHSGWYRVWSILATTTLLVVVAGVIGMAFYSSRRLPTIQRAKRQSII